MDEDQESNTEAEQSTAENLHMYLEPEDPKNPFLTPMDLNPCAHEILEGATPILASISPITGDFVQCTPKHRHEDKTKAHPDGR